MSDQGHWLASFFSSVPSQRAAETPKSVEEGDLRRVLLDFLEVLDSLDRLVNLTAPGVRPSEAPHLEALRKQLMGVFECASVTFFDSAGQPFDPRCHEAVETVQTCDFDDYTVVEEIARGCEWRGEVLRFARVVVARNPDDHKDVSSKGGCRNGYRY